MSADTQRLDRRTALLALAVGVALMLVKFAAYLFTGSAVVLSDALESIVNVLAGSFALYAVGFAHKPADRTHPYGHGKVEFLSAAVEGAMILVAAGSIAFYAVYDLVTGFESQNLDRGVGLVAFAAVVNGVVGVLLVRRGKRSGSIALEASGHHLLTDTITSVVVLAALGIVILTGLKWLDPVAALLVTAWLVRVGVRLVRRSVAGLMDEQDLHDDAAIRSLIQSHVGQEICGFHALRHRHTGRYHWVDFHMLVPAATPVYDAHDTASAIEFEIEKLLGEADATAHIEPCRDAACARCRGGYSPGR